MGCMAMWKVMMVPVVVTKQMGDGSDDELTMMLMKFTKSPKTMVLW